MAIVHILSHAGDVENEMADRDASNQGLGRDCTTEGYPLTATDRASNVARGLRAVTKTIWKMDQATSAT